MRVTAKCGVCGAEATSRCASCYAVAYCCVDCQKSAWPEHKALCSKPYTVKDSKKCGRYMVATRAIEPGEIILREKAAVVGPSLEGARPQCLGCSIGLNDVFHPCSYCKGPLCSKKCEKHPMHVDECKQLRLNPGAMYNKPDHGTMVKRKHLPENCSYQAILPIRAMLLKKLDIKKYKAVLGLQSHLEERKEMNKTEVVKEQILPVVQQFKLQEAHEDMIQNLCGIFDTNCFEICPSNAGDTLSAIFPNAAMMMHSCYKNTRLTFSDDHVLTIIARTGIKKGEPIYHTYAHTFKTTTIRRIGLFSGKHFGCECVRCKDPTELKTFTSAMLCTCGGMILPENPLDLTQSAVWRCKECSTTLPALQVSSQERNIMMERESIQRDDVPGLEDFLARQKKTLAPSHANMLDVKKQLSVAYGRSVSFQKKNRFKFISFRYPGYEMSQLSTEKLKKKIAYCHEVIEALKILEPGLSTQKGLTLYELWFGEYELANRLKEEGKLDKEAHRQKLQAAFESLEESSK